MPLDPVPRRTKPGPNYDVGTFRNRVGDHTDVNQQRCCLFPSVGSRHGQAPWCEAAQG